MKNKQKGIVLIVVMLFMQILTMLGLYSLNSSLLETKMSRQMWYRNLLVQHTEEMLIASEKEVIEKVPSCLVTPTSSQILKKQPKDWWQSGIACSILSNSEFDFYYVVESLGEDNCAYFDSQNKIADYYRLTLLGIDKRMDGSVMLQSTVARPVPPGREKHIVSGCQEGWRRVTIGRQMWREIF